MTNNTPELSKQEQSIRTLVKARGLVETILGVIGLYGFYRMFHENLLFYIYTVCLLLLMIACGILSFSKPLGFTRLNLALGTVFVLTGITVGIIHAISLSVAFGIFPLAFCVGWGFAILYPTLRIRRGLARLTENSLNSRAGVTS